jgi:hypothetical protein
VRAVKAADLLMDRDPWGASWIARHRAEQAQARGDGVGAGGVQAAPIGAG